MIDKQGYKVQLITCPFCNITTPIAYDYNLARLHDDILALCHTCSIYYLADIELEFPDNVLRSPSP